MSTPSSAEVGSTPPETGQEVVGAGRDDPQESREARRSRQATAVLLVIALLGALTAGVLVVVVWRADTEAADRAQAQDVAGQVAGDLVTLTADNARDRVDGMLRVSTDPFREQLTSLSSVFQGILRQGQVAADGRVETIGVEQFGGDTATVLATARTTVRNTEIPAGAVRQYRLAIGVREVDGTWLVSSVDVVA